MNRKDSIDFVLGRIHGVVESACSAVFELTYFPITEEQNEKVMDF